MASGNQGFMNWASLTKMIEGKKEQGNKVNPFEDVSIHLIKEKLYYIKDEEDIEYIGRLWDEALAKYNCLLIRFPDYTLDVIIRDLVGYHNGLKALHTGLVNESLMPEKIVILTTYLASDPTGRFQEIIRKNKIGPAPEIYEELLKVPEKINLKPGMFSFGTVRKGGKRKGTRKASRKSRKGRKGSRKH